MTPLPADDTSFQQINEAQPEDRQPISIEALGKQMHETIDKLLRDEVSRGDIKLLNTALKELRYSLKLFAGLRGHRKVTVFGSARLPPSDTAYQMAIEFGRRMAALDYQVITGAASGIMEAGHIGAGRENSIGINILLPFEQGANKIISGDKKLMNMKYFFTRKLLFVKESDGIALFPGGFGTQDECFEVLTLMQTGKCHIFPIVMVDAPGNDYWTRWQVYIEEMFLKRGLISPEDMALFKVTDSVDQAVDEITTFYRVYHSMRYVSGDLVMRLQHRLSDELMAKIRQDFAKIVVLGTFEQTAALPEEASEPALASMPRLRFRFDRRSLGRLRMLIDVINKEG